MNTEIQEPLDTFYGKELGYTLDIPLFNTSGDGNISKTPKDPMTQIYEIDVMSLCDLQKFQINWGFLESHHNDVLSAIRSVEEKMYQTVQKDCLFEPFMWQLFSQRPTFEQCYTKFLEVFGESSVGYVVELWKTFIYLHVSQ
ncbi:hypothetical protein EIN_409840 [Entamoeba invadens IP1]|uniref:Uncharacterized protein n=1 Tax=Entamoeba invadens IP1 TaxID=370355 RepID=A0A0A1TZQ1_ENTIV|nr:hypothetical protein EIN_409840 [Entamoeba invadens IP1]ELP85665.1 hypothetical protein EIN_409840 [Entamoeba invadens IP1]|eukprot:XP_004185011.1 hypothetical protein EIN_409840 [Entamoeba invadens IP1]